MAPIERFVPAWRWLSRYKSKYWYPDFVAGINLAATMLPKAMAYAVLAGIPPVYGLFACVVAPLMGILFGSNVLIFTGPAGIMAILASLAIGAIAPPESQTYIQLMALLSLMVGGIIFSLGVLRLGAVLRLISSAAVKGFVNAAAIIIIVNQLQDILGVYVNQTRYPLINFISLFQSLEHLNWVLLVLSALAFVAIWMANKYNPKFPGTLLILTAFTLVSWFMVSRGYELPIVGATDYHMPRLVWPNVSLVQVERLLGSALIIAIVAMAEVYSISQSIARRTRRRTGDDQELIGQGLANIATGLVGAYPVCGSFSGTSINKSSGARTGMSLLIFSVLAFFAITVLSAAFYYVPKFILAVIVISAVASLLAVDDIRQLYKVNNADGVVALVTFLVCLLIQPQIGIASGAVLALAVFVWKTMRAGIQILAYDSQGGYFEIVRKISPKQTMVVIKPRGPIVYVNAELIENRLVRLVKKNEQLKVMLLDMSSVYYLDTSGIDMLLAFSKRLHKRGIDLHLTNLQEQRTKQAIIDAGLASCLQIHDSMSEALIFLQE